VKPGLRARMTSRASNGVLLDMVFLVEWFNIEGKSIGDSRSKRKAAQRLARFPGSWRTKMF